jgi:hypothetical protein
MSKMTPTEAMHWTGKLAMATCLRWSRPSMTGSLKSVRRQAAISKSQRPLGEPEAGDRRVVDDARKAIMVARFVSLA